MNHSFLIALIVVSLSVLIHATSDLCAQFPEGCAQVTELQKRKSSYMRFGKRSAGDAAEYYESDESPAMVKRKSAYMRFGKRSAGPIVEMVPVEMSEPSFYMEKRKPASIRFG